MKNEKIKRK